MQIQEISFGTVTFELSRVFSGNDTLEKLIREQIERKILRLTKKEGWE